MDSPVRNTPFDVSRAIIRETPIYDPLLVKRTMPLTEALASGKIGQDVPVLVIEHAGQHLVIGMLEMIYHHAAQGDVNGNPWMVSFCVICNAGVTFTPMVDGKVHHFAERGLYNAMTILSDSETGSLWNHLTGECLHGPLQGKSMKRLGTPQQMIARNAAETYPAAQFIHSVLSPEVEKETHDEIAWSRNPEFSPRLAATMGAEDPRLPRLDMGLGIWTDSVRRYYRIIDLNGRDNALIDKVNGRPVLVYVDPDTSVPNALFIDAKRTDWAGDVLQIGDGKKIRAGGVYDAVGKLLPIERPLQLFARWYSFAHTFPGCGIFGHLNT